jgi:hypothetical protein
MKGLEPSTFCMASASDRSLPFASVRSNRPIAGFLSERANGSEPERTANLAILATGSAPNPGSASFSPATRGGRAGRLSRGHGRTSVGMGSSPVIPLHRFLNHTGRTSRAASPWKVYVKPVVELRIAPYFVRPGDHANQLSFPSVRVRFRCSLNPSAFMT